ncbi:MAG: insulinase family protein [Oscillospiraceae bacterium]|nr:insulinase family protein [Oscillospiraceae bacterium]
MNASYNIKAYETLGEKLYAARTPCGLPVFVMPKPGLRRAAALLAVRYGSADTRFAPDGAWRETPAGTAHFLEHKLFDMPDGTNAMRAFEEDGASVNAATGHAVTAYHFSAAERFGENLERLLSFVFTPWFTPESVQKEQGIIGQEIRMMADDPHNRVFENLLGALYARHPARRSIAGSEASVAALTHQTLYDCHRAFYRPDNMCLCVSGDVSPDLVADIAGRRPPQPAQSPPARDYGDEPGDNAARDEVSETMDVSLPLFALGAVCPPPSPGPDTLRFELLADLALEALTGRAAPLYARLYGEGLINRDFSWGCCRLPEAAFLLCLGESREPARVRALLWAEAARLAREGIDPALFARLKRAALGERLRGLDDPLSLCRAQAAFHFADVDYFEFAALLDALTPDHAAALLENILTPTRTALSVVRPG